MSLVLIFTDTKSWKYQALILGNTGQFVLDVTAVTLETCVALGFSSQTARLTLSSITLQTQTFLTP